MSGSQQNALSTLLFAIVVALVGTDILADVGSGAGMVHVGLETAAVGVSALGAVWFARRLMTERREAAEWKAQAESLLAGVGQTVEQQFDTWGLTPAEAEVATLLLKGLSFKEIASVRNTSERTAREQAGAAYKKAGVAGRAELSAWFIEDLL